MVDVSDIRCSAAQANIGIKVTQETSRSIVVSGSTTTDCKV